MESYHSVAIIGAGLSGLYAAHLLKKQFPDLVLLEAQNRVGGRVRQLHGLAPWPIEEGAEFVHGRNSVFVRFCEEQLGVKWGEKDWPDWWYFGREVGGQGLVNDAQVDDEVDKVHELFDGAEDEAPPPPGRDVSAAAWMRAKGCTPRQMAVADACYANDFGCSLEQLGLREMIIENKEWDSGETYLLMDRSMGAVVERLRAGQDVRTNWVVDSVTAEGPSTSGSGSGSTSSSGVAIRAKDGRTVRCRAVLVTVPLRILQDNCIRFSPPLPPAKRDAMSRVRMGNCIKIALSFKRQFWRDDMYDVVCPGAFVPEFWMLKRPVTDNDPSLTPHILVGFVAGERAAACSALGEAETVRRFLQQLDEVFGSPSDPRPASSSLHRQHVQDWSKEEYARGAYTYPSLGAEAGDRAALAAPVAGRVFFAGEHTNESINPCMQGAMATAERAAREISAALAQADAVALRSRL